MRSEEDMAQLGGPPAKRLKSFLLKWGFPKIRGTILVVHIVSIFCSFGSKETTKNPKESRHLQSTGFRAYIGRRVQDFLSRAWIEGPTF